MVHTKLLHIPTKKIHEVLKTVNLKDTGKKLASQFSMGMKQRLGLACALLNDPELLILDEPTNGLDPFGIQELRELITSFSEKGIAKTVISSHILSEVAQIADTVGILSGGELLYQGTPDSGENLEDFFLRTLYAKEEKEMHSLQSEFLKYKRTFMKKLILLFPVFFTVYALVTQVSLMDNPQSENSSWGWQSLFGSYF